MKSKYSGRAWIPSTSASRPPPCLQPSRAEPAISTESRCRCSACSTTRYQRASCTTHTRRRTSRCSDYLRGYLGNQSILSSSGGCFVQCTQSAYTSVRMQHADAFRHRYMTPCCCRQWHRLCGAKERTSTPPSSVRRKRESSTRRAVCLKPLVRGVLLEHTGCTRAPSMRACDRHKNRFRTDPVDECTTTYKYHELGFSLIQFEKKKSMKQRSMHGMVYGTPNERQLATASKFGDLVEPETETNAPGGVRDAKRTSDGDSV